MERINFHPTLMNPSARLLGGLQTFVCI
jgi:hypothetical protein